MLDGVLDRDFVTVGVWVLLCEEDGVSEGGGRLPVWDFVDVGVRVGVGDWVAEEDGLGWGAFGSIERAKSLIR